MDFIIRPWHENDLESLVRYANNPEIAKNMSDLFPYPYTEENGKEFISFAIKENPARLFAIVIDGQAVGGIGILPQDDIHCRNAELGYWLGEPFWGKGIITGAIKRVTEIAFSCFDIDRIFARPFGTNAASQRALEKAGYIPEAKFEKTIFKNGEYLDELVYAIRRQNLKT